MMRFSNASSTWQAELSKLILALMQAQVRYNMCGFGQSDQPTVTSALTTQFFANDFEAV
jgi:hypothetical protein